MQDEYELSVSKKIYLKCKNFVNSLNKRDQVCKSWDTRILEWLRLQKIKDNDNLFNYIIHTNFFSNEEYSQQIILTFYSYKHLILYAMKNGVCSLNRALDLLIEETKSYFKQKNTELKTRLKSIQEDLQMIIKEGTK